MGRRGFCRNLVLAVLFAFILWWISHLVCNSHMGQLTIQRSPYDEFVVPRGQSFFYSYPDAFRHSSFEVWRPKEFFAKRTHHSTDNILVLVRTSTGTVWQKLPTLLLTVLTSFPNHAVYSDGADMIGDTEVIDALGILSSRILQNHPQLEPYRLRRSIREHHLPIDLEELPKGPDLDKYKILPMLLHAYHTVKTDTKDTDIDWYVVMSDESSLFAQNLRDYLKLLNPAEPLYLGSAVAGLSHLFADGGSVIVLSRATMAMAFGDPRSPMWVEEYTQRATYDMLGDYVLATFLKEKLGISLDVKESAGHFQGNPPSTIAMSAQKWCTPIISTHHHSPRDTQILWEYQNMKKEPILYSDLYLDFIKPYIPQEPQYNWDNFAKDIEFSIAGHYDDPNRETQPYGSLTRCRQACDSYEDCLMLRYDPYKQYCGLAIATVTLGHPIVRYDTDTDSEELCATHGLQCHERDSSQGMVSEWFPDRIREMRRHKWCDSLYMDVLSEGFVYGALDQTEGWWLRARVKYQSSDPSSLFDDNQPLSPPL